MASSTARNFLLAGKKIVAIGRNYAEHIKELNNTAPTEPFFFLKPTTSYLPSGGTLEIPRGIIAHHEVELGLIISKRGRDIRPSDANAYIAGYTLAVDMTARNLQSKVKSLGLPWSAAKGFDGFTPISTAFLPSTDVKDPTELRLTLAVNNQLKQDGKTKDMIFGIPRLLEHVSSIMTLEEGDLILTGTPSGVGPVNPGDRVSCTLEDIASGKILATLEFDAVERDGGYIFEH
ncbi:hypothetical protein AX14_010222 [Amanita brunnescens Koide BX004]|nr:hypothetical protein AX14_010222 [Amanita brunnescens Koide BX004]